MKDLAIEIEEVNRQTEDGIIALAQWIWGGKLIDWAIRVRLCGCMDLEYKEELHTYISCRTVSPCTPDAFVRQEQLASLYREIIASITDWPESITKMREGGN